MNGRGRWPANKSEVDCLMYLQAEKARNSWEAFTRPRRALSVHIQENAGNSVLVIQTEVKGALFSHRRSEKKT